MYIVISEFSNVFECVFHSTRKFQINNLKFLVQSIDN
nr:MAG TPA: hypothetical protein [Caudoviricetes sp.]